VLVGHGVTRPPTGRILQLWLMRAGVPTSAGVFLPNGGVVALPVHVDPGGFDGVAVTIERGPDGSAQPTRPPSYAGVLTA
jgi:Anti-sigma-K factor rskA